MKREIMILIAAILCGIAAMISYEMYVAQIREDIQSQLEDTVAICVLKRTVGARQMIEGAMLKKEDVPRAFVHPRAVQWSERKLVYGQRVLHPLQPGQPVLWSDLQEQSKRSVDDTILPGRGVVAIPIDMVGGVSGLITPGARVDLIGVFKKLPTTKGADQVRERMLRNQNAQSLAELNQMLEEASRLALESATLGQSDFYVLPVAYNLGVFSVGAQTQAGARSEGEKKAYSTLTFDVPRKTQFLLIMAMHKVQTEGGRLVCVLRSNQAGGETLGDPGKAYPSNDFLELISNAQAEMEESK